MRKIRKITTYVCTACYRLFPTAATAKDHYARNHREEDRATSRATYRKKPTQAGKILDAIRAGHRDAPAIAKATRIPLTRVHSLLSYHRRRGNVKGFTGSLKVVD